MQVLPRIAGEALREAQAEHNADSIERCHRTAEEIKWLTDRAAIAGVSRATEEFNLRHKENPVHRTTTGKYLSHFKSEKEYERTFLPPPSTPFGFRH